MKTLITGGSGFLGSALSRSLLADGHQVFVLTRNPRRARLPVGTQAVQWDGRTCEGWLDVFNQADAVVNLAGATIGLPFWTAKRKALLVGSRVDSGLALSQAFQKAQQVGKGPKVLVQASGVGYYGVHDEKTLLDESAPPGSDFLASLAVDWEASTNSVESRGVRRVVIRTAIVLGHKGILPLMALPVRMFAGGPVGDGRQGTSWIHIDDHVRAVRFLIENETARGVYNLAAPQPLSNADFMRSLAKALRRPYWLPAPAFAFRAAFGEMSTLFLEGQFALPKRLLNEGFTFKFKTASQAFEDLF